MSKDSAEHNTSQAVTWRTEADRKRDARHKMIAYWKWTVHMKWHGFYWRVLHLTRLARPYSKAMCRLNLYRTFWDGRCMWCGNKHGKQLSEWQEAGE